ncbi:MAG: cell division protein FtsA [Alphaproteobacteria bacterium]|nr:cell division protein FtsA [Alphaproteobacteria bacterium]
MANGGIISALDIGSSKICCFIGEIDEQGPVRVIGIGHQASRGVRGGTIVDMEAAEQAVLSAVHTAEQMAGITIRTVVANVTGGGPNSRSHYFQHPLRGGAIDDGDIRRLLNECGTGDQDADRSLIHAIPVGYMVDGANGIRDPRGLHGSSFGVRMHKVTVAAGAVHNLATCVSRCLLDISDLVTSAYAAGLGCLVEDEIDLGVTVVDMGGGTTSIAVFFDGALIYVDSIQIGGHHVTSDIARGLSTPLSQAERLKTLFGSCLSTHADDRETVTVPQVGAEDDGQAVQIPKSLLVGIVAPRIEETMELVRSRLESSGLHKLAGRRLVLTGGASQLPGVSELARQILNKQVRLGKPRGLSGLAEATSGPAFATCAGLLAFAMDDRGEVRGLATPKSEATGGLFGRLGGWLRDNF